MSAFRIKEQPSRLQQLMLAGQALAVDSAFYNMAFIFKLSGELDEARFARAVAETVTANECMHWCIGKDGNLWSAADSGQFNLAIEHRPEQSIESVRKLAAERAQSSLPTAERLFDTCLFCCDDQQYLWYVNFHHVITDAAAFALFYDQVRSAYLGKPRSVGSFVSYLQEEKQSLSSDSGQRAANYWASKSAEYEITATDAKRRTTIAASTERQTIVLDKELMRALESSASSTELRSISADLTYFSLFAAALFILRHRLFDSQSQTLGCPFHKRLNNVYAGPTIEIGFVAAKVSSSVTFKELVKVLQLDAFESMRNCVAGTTTSQINNSFSWLLNYLNNEYGDFAGLQCESSWLHANQGDAAHELRLQVHDFDSSGSLTLQFDMLTSVFTSEQRQRLPAMFVQLIRQCLAAPNTAVADHSLQASSTRPSVIEKSKSYPRRSVLETFEANARHYPNALAVIDDNDKLSYQQLDEKANAMAAEIRKLAIAPLFLPRGVEVLVVILAALKAKVPFVPLDVDHPAKRINDVLSALDTRLLITSDDTDCAGIDAELLLIDNHEFAKPLDIRETALTGIADSTYKIFTSGTTGVPKGVCVGHASLDNYVSWAAGYYADNKPVNMPLFSSLAFDLTLTSIFLPLFTGGTVQVYSQQPGAQLDVLKVFEDDQVNLVKLTPSHLKLVLVGAGKKRWNSDRTLRGLILGGENLSTVTALKAQSTLGNSIRVYNEYGPTEATIGCMIHEFNAGADTGDAVPIGRPIQDASLQLLDNCGQQVPDGFEGVLHIAGDVLALAYWQGNAISGTSYSTGDRARCDENGHYTFLGRTDRQTKFRGARIELPEIESALRANSLVEDVAVQLFRNQEESRSILCNRCGINSNVPGIKLLADGICNVCEKFEAQRAPLQAYFKTIYDLRVCLGDPADAETSCLALASGGKDSSYMVCKLVELGYKPIVFTLDNGYLSEHALANVERITSRLGLQWIRECPADMNLIFSDSLARHSNVCDGCFKTIYTLAINYCLEHGIRSVVTGLSRGQLFETRLIDMLEADVLNEDLIDERVKTARIAYHQIDDAVSDCLDVSAVRNSATFDEISFVDFYRYTDVELADMYSFLENFGDWRRPPDTGRSTNCLINDVGIHVHQYERGHHNYAIPYAWDVRMGHKVRAEAVDELNDDIDDERVREILTDIAYIPKETIDRDEQLVAYVCTTKPQVPEDLGSHLRQQLRQVLPEYAIPTLFVTLDTLPITVSGKLDISALPKPSALLQRGQSAQHTAPCTEIEEKLLGVWQRHFSSDQIGTSDDFFALGGDSIKAVQISADCATLGINVAPTDLFVHANIIELGRVATDLVSDSAQLVAATADSGLADDELSALLGRMDKKA